MLVHRKHSAKVYGKPAQMLTACNALSPTSPPALIKPVATAPSVNAQKTFCTSGGLGKPLDAMMSSTYDPESLLVMKYSAMPKMHRIVRNSVASPYGCRTSKIRSACARQDNA